MAKTSPYDHPRFRASSPTRKSPTTPRKTPMGPDHPKWWVHVWHEAIRQDERRQHAARCVFSTYELLENILSFLPMQDILMAQRVNTTFKGIIDRSQKLQRALFFLPAPRPELGKKVQLETNSLVLRKFGYRPQSLPSPRAYAYLAEITLDVLPGATAETKPIKGSWQKMQILQPPCTLRSCHGSHWFNFEPDEQRFDTIGKACSREGESLWNEHNSKKNGRRSSSDYRAACLERDMITDELKPLGYDRIFDRSRNRWTWRKIRGRR